MAVREAIKGVLEHPVVPIVVGTAVAVDGPGNIMLRSIFLGGCGVWLCYDMGVRLWQQMCAVNGSAARPHDSHRNRGPFVLRPARKEGVVLLV